MIDQLSIRIDKKVFDGTGSTSHVAIDGLEFSVEKGQFIAITGPSGCGKTTLLNVISGLDENYDGEVSSPPSIHESLVYLFQTPRLLPWRTVLQNITLVLDENQQSQAYEYLKDVELEKFANHFPSQLSLGMQKRVSLIRAFALKPTLLLMDEPFSSLDTETTIRMHSLLKRLLKNQSTTTILVTHDQEEANQLGDRVLSFSGPPANILTDIKR